MAAIDRNIEVAQALSAAIRNDLQKLDSTNASERQKQDSKVEGMINDLQQKISSIRGQMNSITAEDRDLYAEDLKELEKERSDYQTELRQKRQAFSLSQQNQEQHDANMEKGEKIVRNLDTAMTIGNDTIRTQENTINTLEDDQRRLDNIDSNLNVVDTEGLKGETTAKRMYRRQILFRILAWAIVVILVAFLIFSIYWKVRPQ
ncbi:Vesicle transport v-SNARE protein [Tritrichomonas foetus]|uniref:Vesicle transport v-SNARE protein n=1 Tax=Tritrichomonas foetus TaxID=1144522 RepID=A0A1J4KN33_9EUKA|nr:Vesicle transport v-SNARE protein [Tritrichomonas foetus]|eukprot:OHT11110.1 Vesicle transport v-SNARE protein [Tritrichomonas foetus]